MILKFFMVHVLITQSISYNPGFFRQLISWICHYFLTVYVNQLLLLSTSLSSGLPDCLNPNPFKLSCLLTIHGHLRRLIITSNDLIWSGLDNSYTSLAWLTPISTLTFGNLLSFLNSLKSLLIVIFSSDYFVILVEENNKKEMHSELNGDLLSLIMSLF